MQLGDEDLNQFVHTSLKAPSARFMQRREALIGASIHICPSREDRLHALETFFLNLPRDADQ